MVTSPATVIAATPEEDARSARRDTSEVRCPPVAATPAQHLNVIPSELTECSATAAAIANQKLSERVAISAQLDLII